MEEKKIEKFVYNPEALDICEFEIVVDHLHWKLLCKQAQDFSTTTSHLLAMLLEKYLIKTGYLDPKNPTSDGLPLSVTLREIREEPDNLFSFQPAAVFPGSKEEPDRGKKSSDKLAAQSDDEDDFDFSDFLE